MTRKLLVLKSTGAIGDAVIATALYPALLQKNYRMGIMTGRETLALWETLDDAKWYPFEDHPHDPDVPLFADVSGYYGGPMHSAPLPSDFDNGPERMGHLCEWMAYNVRKQTRVKLNPSRDDVKVELYREEIESARKEMGRIKKKNGRNPLVLLFPYSAGNNKSLPREALEGVVRGISDFAIPYMFGPVKGGGHIDGLVQDRWPALRQSAAMMYAADAVMCMDSGPLHMTSGVLQGTPAEYSGGLNVDKSKVVLVVGSSHPEVVGYEGNRVVQSTEGCDLPLPCGAHGYWPVKEYTERFGEAFFKSHDDATGCVNKSYKDKGAEAACMKAIPAESIVAEVRDILK
jgi:hypothetical protein